MQYLEDYVDAIQHLPSELKPRFTDMRKLDENVHKTMSDLKDQQKAFFGSCRKLKLPERDDEFNNIRSEFQKVVENSKEKIKIAEEVYELLDKYIRKLDQDLGVFKLELEADNRGITEILEKNSLEMDQPTLSSHKENRVPKKSRKHTTSLFNGSSHVKSERMGSLSSSSMVDNLLPGSLNPSLPMYGAPASSSPNPFANMEPFAMAASQAIAATQQFGSGRRTTLTKTNLESVSFSHEFGGSSAPSGTDTPTSVGSPSSAPVHKKKKAHSRNASQSLGTPTSLLLDVVMNGSDSVTGHGGDSLLDSGQGLGWGSGDVDEPRYCICNQVSWGDMVGCDNGECPFEWFHYSCIGITTPPKGKWYCSACSATMSRKKTSRKQ